MTKGQAAGDAFDAPTRAVMPSEGATTVHLLRHGAVEGFGRREVRGHLDVPPSPEGLRQHERLVAFSMAHLGRPAVILCSDLLRCRALGEQLARATGAPLVLDPRLREQSMGAWEGRTWEELTAAHGRAVNDYWDDYLEARPPGGESLRDAGARILQVWSEAIAPRRGETVAVVTHVGPIRILVCHALGLGLDQALRFAPPAASVTSLLVAEAGCVLQSLGERPWLVDAGDGRPMSAIATSPVGQAVLAGGTPRPPAGDGARADAPARLTTGAPRPPAVGTRPCIALSGSAGTGKTTLGRRLAAALGVPFLEEGMRRRLEEGLDLHRLRHADLQRLVDELWQQQQAAEDAATDGFVADRSAADFAAFWIHYGFHHDAAATEPWLARAVERLQRYDRVVLLPWGVLPLRSDGVRSANRWVQFMFQSLVEGLLLRHAPAGRLLRMPAIDGVDERLAWVRAQLG